MFHEAAGRAGVGVHKLRSSTEHSMGTQCHPRAWAETQSQDAGWTGLRRQQVSVPGPRLFLGLEHGTLGTCLSANLIFLSRSVNN